MGWYNDELYHHGIKGQKWGVRRFQNSDGTLTSAGKQRYSYDGASTQDKAKRLLSRELDADVAIRKRWEQYDNDVKKLDKIAPKEGEFWDENFHMTAKAAKYMDARDKLYDEARDFENKQWKAREKEELKLRKDVFANKDIKEDVIAAGKTLDKLKSVYEDTISENSSYAKKAYEQYKKNHKDDDDAEYGFYHYTWRAGNAEYDKANAEYAKQTKDLSAQYDKQITNIGKKVVGELADVKINKSHVLKSYGDAGKYEIDNILRFYRKDVLGE